MADNKTNLEDLWYNMKNISRGRFFVVNTLLETTVNLEVVRRFQASVEKIGFNVKDDTKKFLDDFKDDNMIEIEDCLGVLFIKRHDGKINPPLNDLKLLHADRNEHFKNKPRIAIYIVETRNCRGKIAEDSAMVIDDPVQAGMLIVWILTRDASAMLRHVNEAFGAIPDEGEPITHTVRRMTTTNDNAKLIVLFSVTDTLTRRLRFASKRLIELEGPVEVAVRDFKFLRSKLNRVERPNARMSKLTEEVNEFKNNIATVTYNDMSTVVDFNLAMEAALYGGGSSRAYFYYASAFVAVAAALTGAYLVVKK